MADSMFALAMPGRPEVFPFDDRAAAFYRRCGYSGVYLENDYKRFGPCATYGCWQGVSEVLSLWRFSKDETSPRYLEWITEQAGIAHRHGLKIYLKTWDPRVPVSSRDRIPEQARGATKHEFPANVCVMSPAGRRFIRDFHLEAIHRLSMVDGLIVGVDDNWADFCDDTCPHCAGIDLLDRVIHYFELLHEVIEDAHSDIDLILYDWVWKEEKFTPNNLINRYLGSSERKPRFVTRFTQWAHQEIQGYEGQRPGILDCTLAVDGPGPVTLSYADCVKNGRLRLLDMISTGHGAESWAHPYPPVPGIFYRRLQAIREQGFDGFMDYDCGSLEPGIIAEAIGQFLRGENIENIDSFLDTLAENSYGSKAVCTLRQAWSVSEQAVRNYPLDMCSSVTYSLNSRVGFSMAMSLGLVPELELFQGKEYWGNPFICYPYSVLAPDVAELQEERFAVVAENMEGAARLFVQAAQLADAKHKAFAQREASRTEALALAYRCQQNWACMAKCVYEGQPGRTPADASWVRKAFQRELDLTVRYAQLHRNDLALFSNPTWDMVGVIQLCQPWRSIDRDKPFDDKIAILNARLLEKR